MDQQPPITPKPADDTNLDDKIGILLQIGVYSSAAVVAAGGGDGLGCFGNVRGVGDVEADGGDVGAGQFTRGGIGAYAGENVVAGGGEAEGAGAADAGAGAGDEDVL